MRKNKRSDARFDSLQSGRFGELLSRFTERGSLELKSVIICSLGTIAIKNNEEEDARWAQHVTFDPTSASLI